VYGPMGFYDAFNPTLNWYTDAYLAIDQGPIVNMIENHRTRLLWNLFMDNDEIAPALLAAGFVPDSTTVSTQQVLAKASLKISPNPSVGELSIRIDPAQWSGERLLLEVISSHGQVGFRQNLSPHSLQHQVTLPALAPGNYYLRLSDGAGHSTQQVFTLNNRS